MWEARLRLLLIIFKENKTVLQDLKIRNLTNKDMRNILLKRKINETSACSKFEIHFSNFNSRQLAVLTLFNLIVVTGNVSLNILAIYILNKTKQIANVAFKLIFMVSASDVLTGIFVQSLFLVALMKRIV